MKDKSGQLCWKLLMVDDDEDDFLLVHAMLSDAQAGKYSLEWADTFEAGRGALQNHYYNAVLVDYDLGGHTGLELIREATAQGFPGAFILYTGRGSYQVDLDAMQAGASMYLTKGETSALMLERGIRYAVERKQQEQLLAAHQAQLEAIFEAQPDVVLLYDPELNVLRANHVFQETYGFDPVGMHNKEIAKRVSVRTLSGTPYAGFWRLTFQEQPRDRFLIRRHDGSQQIIEVSSSPLFVTGRNTGSVVTWHDITETEHMRQHLEEINKILQEQAAEMEAQTEALRQQTQELVHANEMLSASEARLRVALKHMPVMVADLDRDLRYTWIYNPLGGYQLEDVLGQRIGLGTDPEATQAMLKTLRNVLDNGDSARWEIASKTKNGDEYYLCYAEPLRKSHGEITGIALVSMNITQRKRAEEALKRSEEKLRQLSPPAPNVDLISP